MRRWKISGFLLIFFAGTMGIATFVTNLQRPYVDTTIGSYVLRIPKKNMLDMPLWLRFIPAARNSGNELNLEFSGKEIKKDVENFVDTDGEFQDGSSVHLMFLDENCLNAYKDTNLSLYKNPWYGIDEYSESVVLKNKNSDFYRIQDSRWPHQWVAMKVEPRKESPIPLHIDDFWVASCLDGKAVTASGKIEMCHGRMFYKNIMIDYSITGNNLRHIDRVKAFLISKISSWESEAMKNGAHPSINSKPLCQIN